MRRKRLVSLVAVCLVVMTGAGCWPARGHNTNRTSFNPFETAFTSATVEDIRQLWTFDTSWPDWRPIPTSAVTSVDGVHVASMTETGYRLFALDPDTGDPLWSQMLDSRGLYAGEAQSPPWVVDDRVFISTMRDNANVSDTDHGTTQMFDTATGDDLGVVADGGDLQAVTDGSYGALIVPDMAGFPADSSYTMWLGTLVPTGASLQHVDLASGWLQGRDGIGGVTIGRGLIFYSGTGVLSTQPGSTRQGGALRAYSITELGNVTCGPLGSSGLLVECPRWVTPSLDIAAGSAPVLDPDRPVVYVSAGSHGLRAFDTATGTELWQGTWTIGQPSRTPALAYGKVYAGTGFGLAVYDAAGCGAATCPPLWETGPLPSGEGSPGQAAQQPAVAGDVVFVPVLADGFQPRLVAFDADGCGQPRCEPIWGTDLPGRVTGELTISGGHIYVPTNRGLVAFGL